jgi:hypothetical protein
VDAWAEAICIPELTIFMAASAGLGGLLTEDRRRG